MKHIPKISLYKLINKILTGDIPQFSKLLFPKVRFNDYFYLMSIYNIYSYNQPLTNKDCYYYDVKKEDFYMDDYYRHKKYISARLLYNYNNKTVIKPYYCLDVKDFHKTDFKYRVFLSSKDKSMYDRFINTFYKFGINNIRNLILENSKPNSSLNMFNYYIFNEMIKKNIPKEDMFLLFHFVKNLRFNYISEHVYDIFKNNNVIQDNAKYNSVINNMDKDNKYFYESIFGYIRS